MNFTRIQWPAREAPPRVQALKRVDTSRVRGYIRGKPPCQNFFYFPSPPGMRICMLFPRLFHGGRYMINLRVGGGKDKDDDDERITRIKIYVTADKRQARTFSSECIIQED